MNAPHGGAQRCVSKACMPATICRCLGQRLCLVTQPSLRHHAGPGMKCVLRAKSDGHDDDAVGCIDLLDALIASIDGRCSAGCCGMPLCCAQRDPAAPPCAWQRRSAVLLEAAAAGTAPSRRPPMRQVIVEAKPLAGSGGHLLTAKARSANAAPVGASLPHVAARPARRLKACSFCFVVGKHSQHANAGS